MNSEINIYLSAIDWGIVVNIIIAFAAIMTAYYARKTLMSSLDAKQEERESRRAFIAPLDSPGFAFPSENKHIQLRIVLKNYGTNPVAKARSLIFGICKAHKNDKEEILPIFCLHDDVNNIIPSNSELIFEYSQNRFKQITDSSFARLISEYIVQIIVYKDLILGKTYTERFYWGTDELNKLSELPQEILNEMMKIDFDKYLDISVDTLLDIK